MLISAKCPVLNNKSFWLVFVECLISERIIGPADLFSAALLLGQFYEKTTILRSFCVFLNHFIVAKSLNVVHKNDGRVK